MYCTVQYKRRGDGAPRGAATENKSDKRRCYGRAGRVYARARRFMRRRAT